jgi:hypothetical protein
LSSRQRFCGGEQRHGGLMPVLGLAADDTHGLVEQDGDLRGLLALGLFVHLDAVVGCDLQPMVATAGH